MQTNFYNHQILQYCLAIFLAISPMKLQPSTYSAKYISLLPPPHTCEIFLPEAVLPCISLMSYFKEVILKHTIRI